MQTQFINQQIELFCELCGDEIPRGGTFFYDDEYEGYTGNEDDGAVICRDCIEKYQAEDNEEQV